MHPVIRLATTAVAASSLAGCAGFVRNHIYQPDPMAATPVTFANGAPEQVTARTADGLALQGYYWPPEPGRAVIVYFHGNGGNQLAAAENAAALRAGGHGVLVASYRGYGGNPGRPSEAGLTRDGDAWFGLARELVPEGQVFLFGHSLGGAVALATAAHHPVAGVATLGTFARLADVAPGYSRPFLPDRWDNSAAIQQASGPVYLFHGTQDDVVPFAQGEALAQAAGAGPVELIPLEGGGHYVDMARLAPVVWERLERAPASAVIPSQAGLQNGER